VAPDAEIEGLTAPHGRSLITNPDELATAASAVADLVPPIAERLPDGVIVAGFGDPGLSELQRRLDCPVTGIAEASMLEAAAIGRFAVATTTPDLIDSISRLAEIYGYGSSFVGTFVTEGDPVRLMDDPTRLVHSLLEALGRAAVAGAEAIVIGGGPLSLAARALRERLQTPIIEPIPAAVRLAITRSQGTR
jgi:Asp/Glu/hydantoin racemase